MRPNMGASYYALTATLALAGYGVTLFNDQRKEQLTQSIARVNEQLR